MNVDREKQKWCASVSSSPWAFGRLGRILVRAAVVAFCAVLVSSCTHRNLIELDYPQYLLKNSGAPLPRTAQARSYSLTPNAQSYRFEFRAASTGIANLWVVDVGTMLDDTLLSNDVQLAFGGLERALWTANPTDSRGHLVFDLQQYTFRGFGAHVALKVTFTRSGKFVFEKLYTEDGKPQAGKMSIGGAFAQKNAVQQSTKLAMDAIVRQLITDLNAQANAAG